MKEDVPQRSSLLLRLQRALEYLLVLRIPIKVQIHIAFVLFLSELLDDESLSDLSGSPHQKAFSAFFAFPVQKPVIDFSFQHTVTCQCIFVYYTTGISGCQQRMHLFGGFQEMKMHFLRGF